MIRRVAAWLRRSWSLMTDVHGAAESEALVRAWTVAVAAQVRQARCAEHPGRPAVVVLRLADGTLVGRCEVCCVVHTPEQLVGPAGVAVAG